MKKSIALALAMLFGLFPCLAQHWFDGSVRLYFAGMPGL